MSWLARWVAFWDEREPPTVLASIRIAIALVMLVDLATIGWHGVATWLWAPLEADGVVGAAAVARPGAESAVRGGRVLHGRCRAGVCVAVGSGGADQRPCGSR